MASLTKLLARVMCRTHPNVMQDVKKRIRAVVSKWLDEIGAPLPSTVELSS